jgi:RHS repeat-associated protein
MWPGGIYSSGQVAYGAVGTPLLLSGSDFGQGGSVWFVPYKNMTKDPNASAVQAPVSLWSETAITASVPANALTGLVEVIANGVPSNGLPFVVLQGAYAGACRAGQGSNPVQIVTDSLQDGAVNHSYSATLQASGGSNFYTWSLASGSLPQGLSLSSSGVISGTPSSSGAESTFTVQVADTSSPPQYDAAALAINIAAQSEGTSSTALYNFSIQATGGASGYDPAGNVVAYTDSVNGAWSFTYDSLNRLATASGSQADNPYPNLCWQYDNFGNRLWQTSSATAYSSSNGGPNACPVSSGPSSGTNYYNTSNQMSEGFHQYDGAGNLTADATNGNSYLYDAEGRVCAVQESTVGVTTRTQYLYDAEGRRVAKGSISTFNCDTTSNGFNPTTVYVHGPGGEQLSEMTNTSGTQTPSWQVAHTNVYAAGQQVATYDADLSGATEGKLYFHLSDWLGTRRQQTDYAGNPVLNFASLPYGDGQSVVPLSNNDVVDGTEHHFTCKERDSESGSDYFGARYLASSMGRWLSPDPLGMAFADPTDPQSLNRYAYVLNNPLIFSDPDGLDCVYTSNQSWNSITVTINHGDGKCTKGGTYVDGYVDPKSVHYYVDGS